MDGMALFINIKFDTHSDWRVHMARFRKWITMRSIQTKHNIKKLYIKPWNVLRFLEIIEPNLKLPHYRFLTTADDI